MVNRPRWYIRHAAQRTDVARNSQNSATITGQEQLVYERADLAEDSVIPPKGEPSVVMVDGEKFILVAVVVRDEVRAAAGR